MKLVYLFLLGLLCLPLTFATDSTDPDDYFFYDDMESGTVNVSKYVGSALSMSTTSPYNGTYSLELAYTNDVTCDNKINNSAFNSTEYSTPFCLDTRAWYTGNIANNLETGFIFDAWANGIMFDSNPGAASANLTYVDNANWFSFGANFGDSTWGYTKVCFTDGWAASGTTTAILFDKNGVNTLNQSTQPRSFLDNICLHNREGSGRVTRFDNLRIWNYTAHGSNPPQAATALPYATVTVLDEYDGSALSGLTVYIGTDSNTTDGSGEATIYSPTGLNYTVDGGTNYFNSSGTATENSSVNAYLYGALPNIYVYNVENTSVLNFTINSTSTGNTTTDGSTYLLLPPDTTTELNISSSNYYDLLYNLTTTPKDTNDYNITGLYQSILTINATNAFSGEPLGNFTGWAYNNDTGFNQTFSTTGNTTVLYVLQGTYIVFIDVYDYSISEDNTAVLNITGNNYTQTFDLYSENSVNINIYSEETGSLITENITVTITGNITEDIYYTATGNLFVENLTDGNYTIKFAGANYTQRTYEVTVADRSSQTLDAYLSSSTDTVTFTVLDFDTSQTLEGANIIQQRLINSTWTTVSSKTSDITGRAQFTYTLGVKYRFQITATNYTAKIFDLDPVIFTSYTIRLQQDLTVDKDIGLFDVNIIYYPTAFINEENNTFTISISSVGGSLESYGFLLEYPGGSYADSGILANGETFTNTSFLITGATFGSFVNLTWWYDSTLGGNKTYNAQFIIDGAANNNTFYNNNNDDYGLGTIDKILIATGFTIVFAGVLTLFGTAVAGIIGALISFGFFIAIGFVSIWVAIGTLLLLALVLFRRTS